MSSNDLPANDLTRAVLTPAMLRVWVVHYTRLAERRVHLEKQMAETGVAKLNPVWLLEHDREAITPEVQEGQMTGNLNDGHLSVILKHLSAIQHAAHSTVPFHLILEDDVVIDPAWERKLSRMLVALPSDWEIVFVGDGCNLHVPWWRRMLTGRRMREAGVFFRGWQAAWWGGGGMSRCAAGYVIRPESARRLLSAKAMQPPYDAAIDWIMNRAGRDLEFRSYWAEPPLVTQGAFESWTKGGGSCEL